MRIVNFFVANYELIALIIILAFGMIQAAMMIAAYFHFNKINAWKQQLLTSHSMWAKLELIIFF